MSPEDRINGLFLHHAHRALMSLGPWEGRIVAFILGRGIGVLVRMFFILMVLFVHAFRGNNILEPEEKTTILVYTWEVTLLYVAMVPDAEPVVENRA